MQNESKKTSKPSINTAWNEIYKVAEQYYREHGNLLVPYRSVYNDVNLGAWLHTQRQAYKKGTLSEERIAMLNAIGMVWVVLDKKNQWNETYSVAEKYFHENGNLLVPRWCVYNGIKLGMWIQNQRQAYKKGTLSEERIAMLNAIGMVWDPQEAQWNETYSVAEQYYLENGNLLVPQWHVYHGVNLGAWLNTQRQAYKKGSLSEERVALLNAIGMVWDTYEAQWNKYHQAAERYYRENGDLIIPYNTVYHGVNLGAWLNTQRQAYKKGTLSEERIAMLNAIGMVWVVLDKKNQWNETYSVVEKYFHENGNLLVPRWYVYHGVNLGAWLHTQRQAYKKGTLSEERIALLNAIGMVWDSLKAQWNEYYQAAEQYYHENGNLLVPFRSVYNDVNLGKWINNQRTAYKQGTLSEERVAMLNAIGMVWDSLKAQWNEIYRVAERYYHENGNLLVPTTTVYNGVNLGTWIVTQRRAYKKGTLSKERVAMLNAIGMVWVVRNNEAQWNETYSVAEQYYRENGNLLVPATTVYHGVNLGAWVVTQRYFNKKGKLSAERVAMLNAIGMRW